MSRRKLKRKSNAKNAIIAFFVVFLGLSALLILFYVYDPFELLGIIDSKSTEAIEDTDITEPPEVTEGSETKYAAELSALGYSEEDIKNMQNKLNDGQIRFVIEKPYDENISLLVRVPYFRGPNFNRYLDFLTNNENLSAEDIVTRVNIGLDYEFYTNTNMVDDGNSLLVLVNKYYRLPDDFVPDDLVRLSASFSPGEQYMRKEAAAQMERMYDDMAKEGLRISAGTAYRSFGYQTSLYDNYAAKDGVEQADTYSARPGFSEHQTGLTIDLHNNSGNAIALSMPEYGWMQENAHKYGYIQRYQKGKEEITGYKSEEWHFRYVGIDTATYLYENDLTLDEYLARQV